MFILLIGSPGANAIGIVNELSKEGVSVVSVRQPTDTTSPSGKLHQSIQFIFSQYDNDQRREKSVTGMTDRLRRGDWTGKATIGYDNIAINGEHKVVKNAKGEIIRNMFLLKANERLTSVQIVDYSYARGFEINPKRLTEIFRNPFYCGLIAHNLLKGDVIPGNHEPLISPDIFLRANEEASKNNHGYTVKMNNNNLPMKGFVKCSECGRAMTGYENKQKHLHYYKCPSIGCSNNVNVNQCHEQHKKLMDAFNVKPDAVPMLKEQLKITFEYMNQKNAGQEEQLISQSKEVLKKINIIDERFALGKIEPEIHEQFKSQYQAENNLINKELDKVGRKLSALDYFIDYSLTITQNINKLWNKSEYEMKQKLQYLMFPEGFPSLRKTTLI